MRALSWSLAGAMGGGIVGYAGLLYGLWGRGTVVALAAAGLAVTFLVPLLIAALGGGAAGTLYNPSGAGTPRKPTYSQAEALAARGLYDQAVAAFEVAIAASPDDPDGYLMVARLHRDRSRRLEDSAAWFKKGLERTQPGSGTALLVVRELAELYAVRLNAGKRAAPVLARVAEERPDTPEGRWAADELRRVKEGSGRRSPE